jgi:predicted RNA-binding protein with PUA-like domain
LRGATQWVWIARVYWLMKSEPDLYSIDDLARECRGRWEGVRNYQARNYLRQMQVDDLALFYHSSTTPPGVAGLARICAEARPDPTQFAPKSPYYDPKSTRDAPRWSLVDVEFVEKFSELVTLERIKADRALVGMLVTLRGMRLSVQPVDAAHFRRVLVLAGAKTRVPKRDRAPAGASR